MTTHFATRPDQGMVRVGGADATTFLQSIVSQDLDPIPDGSGARSLLLTPQGKLVVDFRALRVGDEWWLDCEPGFGPVLAEQLGRYRIRVDVELEDRSTRWGVLEVRGREAGARVAALAGIDLPEAVHSHLAWGRAPDRGMRVVRAAWPGVAGADVLGPLDALDDVRDGLLRAGVEPFAPGAYEAARIEAGVPRLGVDVDERTIPQEAFLEREAVSFTKGCFLGQELVCRIDTRGHVNRHLRGLRVDGDLVPPAGAAVVVDDTERGVVTSIAALPGEHRAVALAMVRREVEPPAEVSLRWGDGEVPARLQALPGS
ncbi:MAG: glycine cleavage T C-terminal barrel domain-containing protein [Acidimicrobiia bacterium]